MDSRELLELINEGESEYLEFKRCGNKAESDVFESICAFANSFGGTILLGVEDSGAVTGVSADNALPLMRNIVNVLNNPNVFDTPIAVEFEQLAFNDKSVIRVKVPNSPQVHSYKGKVLARRGDSDVVIRGSAPLAEICIRKEGIYTEQRVFENVELEDLRPDLIERARSMAVAKRKDHPWGQMTDSELLESAGFYGKDFVNNKTGYNLACVVTLGKDATIRALCPTYKTDAVARITDMARYDDRLIVTTNLIDAYYQLAEFGRKHLPDRFLLDNGLATSARDTILRELLVNCLVHRELTSPFPAKVIIDGEGIRTENASRASFEGPIQPDYFSPMPKNPLIAAFFTHIGLAEQLGSGTRTLYKSSLLYTGREPELEEGTIFRAFVPSVPKEDTANNPERLPHSIKEAALMLARSQEGLKTIDLVRAGHSRRTAQRAISELVAEGKLMALGEGRGRIYRYPTHSRE